tara:strand:- start:209 stop:421 length:213 start_codon:yes stop_codon:yes gene_type:complete
MSAEKIINLKKDPLSIISSEVNDENIPRVVDINHLIARARKEEKKLDKINMLFFGMFALLILIAGILLSL